MPAFCWGEGVLKKDTPISTKVLVRVKTPPQMLLLDWVPTRPFWRNSEAWRKDTRNGPNMPEPSTKRYAYGVDVVQKRPATLNEASPSWVLLAYLTGVRTSTMVPQTTPMSRIGNSSWEIEPFSLFGSLNPTPANPPNAPLRRPAVSPERGQCQ